MKAENRNTGFTLTELICTMVIMTVLAAVLVPACLGFVARARETRLKTEVIGLRNAVQAYVMTAYLEGETDSFLLMERISEVPVTSPDNPLHEYLTVIPAETLIISEITTDRTKMTVREMVVISRDYNIVVSGETIELIPR